jgi:SAM-dependent methyltransferase
LYAIDRDLLDKVITEANRVLKCGGKLAILDFDHPAKIKQNIHNPLLRTYKDLYGRFFKNLGYESVGKLSFNRSGDVGFEADRDLRIAVNLLWNPLY